MAKRIDVRAILEGYFSGLSFNNIASTWHVSKHSVKDVVLLANLKDYTFIVKKANFKYPTICANSIYYLPERSLPKELILNLDTCNFIGHATDIAIFGVTGSGKSYLSCALGKAACMKGKRTLFYRMQDLFLDYNCIETSLQRKKFLKKLANYDLLIIDEWLGDSLNEKQLSFIYELVEKRTEVHSTIFCGQFAPKEWYARLGSSSKTESILNRIFSGLCKVDCGDFNMREYLSSKKMII